MKAKNYREPELKEDLNHLDELAGKALSGISGLVVWSSIKQASMSFGDHFTKDGRHFMRGTLDKVTSRVNHSRFHLP